MTKKAIIEVLLVEESAEKKNEEIEKEILEQLPENLHIIPWSAEIGKVKVVKS